MYGYRLNSEGITSKAVYSEKSIDSYWITEQCLKEFPKFKGSLWSKSIWVFITTDIMMHGGYEKQKEEK